MKGLCQIIAKDENATLGQALKAIEDTAKVHPSLKDAFTKLYAYTSDADGIRHALLEKTDLDVEDARFMLVACSAFVNYLVAKAAKVGIEI